MSWTDRVRNVEVLYTVKVERNIVHTVKEGCLILRCVIPFVLGGVTGFFSDISPSDCTMALGSTELVTACVGTAF